VLLTVLNNVSVLQWEAVYAMSILLALLAVAAFVFCLWGSILCCATGGCCAPTQPTVYVVCWRLQLLLCLCSIFRIYHL